MNPVSVVIAESTRYQHSKCPSRGSGNNQIDVFVNSTLSKSQRGRYGILLFGCNIRPYSDKKTVVKSTLHKSHFLCIISLLWTVSSAAAPSLHTRPHRTQWPSPTAVVTNLNFVWFYLKQSPYVWFVCLLIISRSRIFPSNRDVNHYRGGMLDTYRLWSGRDLYRASRVVFYNKQEILRTLSDLDSIPRDYYLLVD